MKLLSAPKAGAGAFRRLVTFMLCGWRLQAPRSSPHPHCKLVFLSQSGELIFMDLTKSFDVIMSDLLLQETDGCFVMHDRLI